MDQLWTVMALIHIVPLMGFNLDIHHPRLLTALDAGPGSHFGYQVCHFGAARDDSVLVTAPLLGTNSGGVYRCSYQSSRCVKVPVQVDLHIAFGLSLACNANRAMVCGPRLTHGCGSLNYLNGLCVELAPQWTVLQKLKPGFQECQDFGLDAVILFDSSRSIIQRDFDTMIAFIKNIIRMFTDPNAQVAVAQYSTEAHAVFQFENFAVNRDADYQMSSVIHVQGATHTPSAIRYVLEEMMRVDRGMREKSRKLLVVITDGKSNDRKQTFGDVLPLAEKRGVIRIAVGVGAEVSYEELKQVASSPDGVFNTSSFEALTTIEAQLREQIFKIEGINSANARSFKKELSQGGFSAALSGDVSLFGAVGAYTWSGGIVEVVHGSGNETLINASALERDMEDSYLGYAVAVAETDNGTVYFAGAPRYNHTGLVLAFQRDVLLGGWAVTSRIHGSQLGSYFGAEVCVLKTSVEGHAALLLIGSPSYFDQGVGGEVHVCTLENGDPSCTYTLRGANRNELGQFGASMSPCPDLNGDGMLELAIGAPLEDGGQGSVYIFLGRPGGIQTTYSQRIQGAVVASSLRYFGLSVHSAGDLSSDGLADLVVGSKGSAVILRSQPVMHVRVSVAMDPAIIPQDYFHCAGASALNVPVSTATVCVAVTPAHAGNIQAPLQARVDMFVELDAEADPSRLVFYPGSPSAQWVEEVTGTACHNLSISIPGCISDYSAVRLSGRLLVEGREVPGTEGLKSVLSPGSPTSFTHMVLLEKVCGEDDICVPDLRISVNFTSPEVISVPDFPVQLAVEVSNNGEDASNTELTLVHPSSIAFVRAKRTSDQVAVWCVSNTTEFENLTHTVCPVSSTFFRQGAKIQVLMEFAVSDHSSLNDRLSVNVSVNGNNEALSTLEDNFAISSVAVKIPINIIVRRGNSTQQISFPDQILMEHIYMVENIGSVAVPVNVTFLIPVELDSGFLWSVSLFNTDNISRTCVSKTVTGSSFKQNCSGVTCRLIGCTIGLLTNRQPTIFKFTGNINGKGSGVQLEVASSSLLSFDQRVYAQYPAVGFHSLKTVSVLDAPAQARTGVFVSIGVLCGLLLLLVISGVLYKIGFWKAQMPPGGTGESPAAAPGPSADSTSLRETIM